MASQSERFAAKVFYGFALAKRARKDDLRFAAKVFYGFAPAKRARKDDLRFAAKVFYGFAASWRAHLAFGIFALGVLFLSGGAAEANDLWAVALFGARRDREPFTAVSQFRILENVAEPYALTDALGVVRAVNAAAVEAFRGCGLNLRKGVLLSDVLRADPAAAEKIFKVKRTRGTADMPLEFGIGAAVIRANASGAGEAVLWHFNVAQAEAEEKCPLDLITEALDSAPVGFFCADRGGAIRAMNGTLREWLGAAEDSALSYSDVLRESSRRLSPALARVGETVRDSAVLRTPDGRRAPVLVVQTLREHEQGGEALTESFVVRRQEAAAGAPASPEAQIVRLLGRAPIAVAVCNPSALVVEANDALVKLSGGAARVGDDISLAVRLEDRGDVAEQFRKVADGALQTAPIEVKLTDEQGNLCEAHFHAHLANTERGEMVVCYLIDVSDQKQVERQFAQVEKMKAIGELAGGIAHDVNNVLTAIRGNADLLLLRHQPGDPDYGSLNQISAQTERAASVIKHLLAYSKQSTMRREVLQLAEAFDEMNVLLTPLVTERITLDVRPASNLELVKVDPNELQRVIVNLVVNATHAMSSGGTVTLRASNVSEAESANYAYPIMTRGEYVLIEVTDTGTGIPKDIQEKIFQPFFTTKGAGKGTGLGLSTVYGIIKQMNGFIFVESELGVGTTFRIFLPVYRGAELPAAARPKKPDPTATRDLSGSATILLVEDEEAVRNFSIRALEMRGYEVIAAASGEEAAEIGDEDLHRLDLVISDVVMPGMTGPQMMQELRARKPDIKFIFVSGYAEETFREEMVDTDEISFLGKPFSLKQLAVAAKEALEG